MLETEAEKHANLNKFLKCNKLLQNVLVKSKYSSYTSLKSQNTEGNNQSLKSQFKTTKCTLEKCLCCNSTIETNQFHSTNTKQTFTIKYNMNCNTSSIIYLITCKKCHIQYVGQTTRALKDRLTDHRSNIKLQKPTAINIHFNSSMHKLQH